MTKQEFLQLATDAARTSSQTSGLAPGITVAQAALESAWGSSELSRRANNYFGIKAHGKHPSVEFPTSEVRDGKVVRISAEFAAYDSMAQCFACRDRLILGGARYAGVRESAHDPERFARALAKHWATDPQYAEKLLRIYHENKLERLDADARRGDGGASGL